jgi:hypothetical protein
MDRNRVLVRTDSGEVAAQQPTRLVQRNLRTALMLVDGKRSAGEIADQFSDGSIGKSALADLERAGMIRLVTVTNTGEVQPAGVEEKSIHLPGTADVGLPSQVTEQLPGAAEAVIEVITLDDRIEPEPVRKPAPGENVRTQKRSSPDHPQMSAVATIASRAADVSGPADARQEARRAAPPSARRGTRGLLSILVLMVLMAVLTAGIASHLYPYERHRPGIERQLSETLGQPVRIGSISFTWTPLPSVTLEHVVVGADERLTVATVRVVPDPRSIYRDDFVVYDLQLAGVTVTGEALVSVSGWLAQAAQKRVFLLHHVGFDDGTLVLNDAVVNGFRGEWKMDDGGRPQSLYFQSGDGVVSGELMPVHGIYQLKLRGNGWKPDFLAPLVVDYFDSEGVIDSQSIQFSKVYARIADGSVFGDASISWRGSSRFSAQVNIRSVDVAKLIAQTRSDLSMKGTVSGSLTLGPAPLAAAGQGVLVEGNLSLQRGVLNRFDLVEALRAADRHTVRGGTTRFEEGAMRIHIDPQSVRISGLRIQSGLMSAVGQIAVGGHDQNITGGVNVELRTSSGKLRTPISISGPLRDPVLTADRSRSRSRAETLL